MTLGKVKPSARLRESRGGDFIQIELNGKVILTVDELQSPSENVRAVEKLHEVIKFAYEEGKAGKGWLLELIQTSIEEQKSTDESP